MMWYGLFYCIYAEKQLFHLLRNCVTISLIHPERLICQGNKGTKESGFVMKMKKKVTKMLIIFACMLLLLGTTSAVYADTTAQTISTVDLVGKGTSSGLSADGVKRGVDSVVINTDASVKTNTTPVNTGYTDHALPFILSLTAAMVMLWVFVHLNLNQIRYGKSENHEREMEIFRRNCRN